MKSYSIYTKSLMDIPTIGQILVNTINQYSFCLAEKDSKFKKALEDSDVLLPDGVGVTAAVRFLTGEKINKIAGADLHEHVLSELNTKGGSCFYLGSSESTLQKIKDRLSIEYPLLTVNVFSPPYASEFSDAANQRMLDEVNIHSPDVLFIGMTAPKQEKWAHQNKAELNVKMICCIGAVFDFYACTVKRPNKLWINWGFEWLGRLVAEPKRMWKRYLYFGPIFLWHITKVKLYKGKQLS
jgi:N-acetylglucosaminyldiphosphoundecaprenol N-acetyl-beta-D-mannosaminyltransferase